MACFSLTVVGKRQDPPIPTNEVRDTRLDRGFPHPIRIKLSGVPRGGSPLAGYKGCPLEISLFLSRAAAGGSGEEKKALWEYPKNLSFSLSRAAAGGARGEPE